MGRAAAGAGGREGGREAERRLEGEGAPETPAGCSDKQDESVKHAGVPVGKTWLHEGK